MKDSMGRGRVLTARLLPWVQAMPPTPCPQSATRDMTMSWYYAESGQPKGPITEDQLSALVAAGTVTQDTMVWREGMPGWEPLSKARPGGVATPDHPAGPPASSAGTVPCSVCGQAFAPDALVEVAGVRACSACKPLAIQRLREGAPPMVQASHGSGADAGTLSEEEVLARDYEVPVSEAIQTGLSQLFAEPGTLLAGGALVTLVSFAVQAVPYLGGLIALFIQGPLMGGLLLAYLRRIRGGPMEVGDAFQGFGPRFWPLFRAHVVPSLMAGLAYLPAVAIAIPLFVVGVAAGGAMLSFAGLGAGIGLAAFAVIALGGALVSTYLTVSWIYTLALVADRGYRVLPAMKFSRRLVARHFWQHAWLMIAIGLVMLLGLLALCLGLFVAMPVAVYAQAFVCHRVLNGLRPAQAPVA